MKICRGQRKDLQQTGRDGYSRVVWWRSGLCRLGEADRTSVKLGDTILMGAAAEEMGQTRCASVLARDVSNECHKSWRGDELRFKTPLVQSIDPAGARGE
jgi:hypothetical protein